MSLQTIFVPINLGVESIFLNFHQKKRTCTFILFITTQNQAQGIREKANRVFSVLQWNLSLYILQTKPQPTHPSEKPLPMHSSEKSQLTHPSEKPQLIHPSEKPQLMQPSEKPQLIKPSEKRQPMHSSEKPQLQSINHSINQFYYK